MSEINNLKKVSRERRRKHIQLRVRGTSIRPRMVVFRSNKNIYAQLVDDMSNRTIIGASTLTKEIREEVHKASSKRERAKIVGKHVAHLAKEKNIVKIVFDRAGYLYHGRVKALADGAREGGLQF
jgi:large subunit ribosomal protein L18